jgi:hypothetical protein
MSWLVNQVDSHVIGELRQPYIACISKNFNNTPRTPHETLAVVLWSFHPDGSFPHGTKLWCMSLFADNNGLETFYQMYRISHNIVAGTYNLWRRYDVERDEDLGFFLHVGI